jgi:hypothetical protein
MIFDVMIREGFKDGHKQIINVYRVHDAVLSKSLRDAQNDGKFIISVIPLFRHKEQNKKQVDSIGE